MRPLLFLSFFLASAPAWGQSAGALRVACNSATGSLDASDTLAKLNNLPPDTPNILDTINACSSKLQALQQKEDSEWKLAQSARDARNCANARQAFTDLYKARSAYQLKARDELNKLSSCKEADVNSTCADAANNLQKAQGAVRTGNWAVARSLLNPIQSCPGIGANAVSLLQTVERTETNDKLNSEAVLLIRQQKFAEACTKLSQIEATDTSYKGLSQEKTQAGGCAQQPVQQARLDPADNVKAGAKPQSGDAKSKPDEAKPKDELKDKYEQAARLVETDQYQQALPLLEAIRKVNRSYMDVQDLLKKCQDGIRKINEGTTEQRVAAFKQQAQILLSKGEFVAANDQVAQALKLKPDDSLQQLKQQIENAKSGENVDLIAGINAYYAGKYNDAEQRLGDFLKKPHAARITALARFYSGAAMASAYYLSGMSDPKKVEDAKQAFTQTVKMLPNFYSQLDWKAVSPKISALFLEATGKQ